MLVIPITMVKTLGKIAGHFKMLFLVLSHRHFGGSLYDDIRGLLV